jgi:hypothetical protein
LLSAGSPSGISLINLSFNLYGANTIIDHDVCSERLAELLETRKNLVRACGIGSLRIPAVWTLSPETERDRGKSDLRDAAIAKHGVDNNRLPKQRELYTKLDSPA